MDGSHAEAAKQVAGESRAWSTLDHYPLVLVVCRDGFSMSEMEECLMPSEEAFRRKKPFVTLRDFRAMRSGGADALQRRRLAQWQDEWRAHIQTYCLGIATVSSSPLIRGAMRAIFWMSPPPSPEEVFADLPSAARWLEERLRSAGVATPPYLASLKHAKTP